MREKIDIAAVIMILLGIIIFNSNNTFGSIFVGLGILKWILGR